MMEERLQKPCIGVVAHVPDLTLDEEDSLGLPSISTSQWTSVSSPNRPLRIAVIALPSISNFTDLDSLRTEVFIDLRLIRTPEFLELADVILIPGSKQTASDLAWLREEGLDAAILEHAQSSLVVGICGGMQMLGQRIDDPDAIESEGAIEGLGLLPIQTTMQPDKTTVRSHGQLASRILFNQPAPPTTVCGYEIHVGKTEYLPDAFTFANLGDETAPEPDGCIDFSTRIFGTYLHGVFDDDTFRHLFLNNARAFHELAPATALSNYQQARQDALNAFAAHVEASLDMPTIFSWAGLTYEKKSTLPDSPLELEA